MSESAIRDVVRYYTREAGVRNLEREISKIFRKVAKELVLGKRGDKKVMITPRNVDKYLGVRQYRYGMAEENNEVGQVKGLAWTEVGGELLTIEATILPGKGKLMITGKLGDVMQESIQAAMSTCPKGQRPRMVQVLVSVCAPPWSRPLPVSPCVPM